MVIETLYDLYIMDMSDICVIPSLENTLAYANLIELIRGFVLEVS